MAISDVQEAFASAMSSEKDDDNSGSTGDNSTTGDDQSNDDNNVDDTSGTGTGDESGQSGGDDQSDESDITWGKALGVDDKLLSLDENGNFKGIITNVNGQNEIVDLPTLVAGFQNNRNNTQKSQALAAEKQEFDQIREKAAQDYVKRVETVEALVSYLSEKLVGDAKNIDWNKLRMENPGEYAARVQDFNLKRAEVEQYLAAVAQERERLNNETMGQQAERFKAFQSEQAATLIRNNPEWKSPEKMTAAFTEMSKFATETYGFSMDEFNSVADARLIGLLQDAIKFRKGTDLSNNKIPPVVPKFQKSNGKTGKQSRLHVLTKIAKESTGAKQRSAQNDAIAELLLNGE